MDNTHAHVSDNSRSLCLKCSIFLENQRKKSKMSFRIPTVRCKPLTKACTPDCRVLYWNAKNYQGIPIYCQVLLCIAPVFSKAIYFFFRTLFIDLFKKNANMITISNKNLLTVDICANNCVTVFVLNNETKTTKQRKFDTMIKTKIVTQQKFQDCEI